MSDEDVPRLAQCLDRSNGAIGPNLQDQPLEVRSLPNAHSLDLEVDLPHGRVDGVNREDSYRQPISFGGYVVPGAFLHVELYGQPRFI